MAGNATTSPHSKKNIIFAKKIMTMEPDKYQNKYRIPTNRLRGWDYGANGCYVVTICTQNRKHYFGEIVKTVETDNYPSLQSVPPTVTQQQSQPLLQSAEIGKIAIQYWTEISQHFPFVVLDEFVVMPNHIHGILFFNKNEYDWQPNKFGNQSQNLGSVIRGFKSSLKRYANEHNIEFAWQERFYDAIIRNYEGLNNVRNYIFNNPQNWANDKLNLKI
jgi:REP element-mobilizing transposase RayT